MSLEVDIRKSFGAFTLDVNLKAGAETIGFLGESGCGKSLTLRCIAGAETPDEGRIVVNGNVFFDSEAKINLTPQQRKTALLFQNYMLFPNLTVQDNVAAGIGKGVAKDERRRIVQEELRRFGLSGFEKRYPSQLSGGQQQRVALARMLAARPGILMLDEPFSALDAHLKSVLEQNLVGLFDTFEGTILYVSHDIDEALRFCDRIAVVDAGRIMEIDTGDELVDHPQSKAALKLSGCKNTPAARYVDDHHVLIPRWGITITTDRVVPRDVICLGIRAMNIERADGPGENNFHVRVDRMSRARFENMVLLGFAGKDAVPHEVSFDENEMTYLHQHLFWRIPRVSGKAALDLQVGDELWIHLPKDRLYLVAR